MHDSTSDPRHPGLLIRDVSRALTCAFARLAASSKLRLTVPQCKVLLQLKQNEGASQVRLAELCDTDPMTLGRVIDRMESDGWIERRPSPFDRRAHQIYLKTAAEPVLAEVSTLMSRSRDAALTGFSNSEQEMLIDLLDRLRCNLDALVTDLAADANTSPAGESAEAGQIRRGKRVEA